MRTSFALRGGAAAVAMAAVLLTGMGAGSRANEGDMSGQRRAGWESVGVSGGGAMFAPAISPHDPDLIFVHCNMSCAFRSTDGGQSWRMLHYSQLMGTNWCRPVFHPSDPRTVYAASGYEGELKISRDAGASWSAFGRGLPKGLLELAIDPGDGRLLLAGLREGGYRSLDGGQTWARCAGLRGRVVGFHIDARSPASRRRCFAGTSEGIFRSDDGGATWSASNHGLPWTEVQAFAGGSEAGSGLCTLYCSVESRLVQGRFAGGVYRSEDGGETWEWAMGKGISRPTEGMLPQYAFLLTTNVRPQTVYGIIGWGERQPPREGPRTPSRVYRSDDGGRSWRAILFPRRREEGFNIEPTWITEEMGGWLDMPRGANINPANPDQVIVVDSMRCFITRDGGKSWKSAHTRRAAEQGAPAKGQRWANTGLVVTSAWHYYIDPFEHDRHYIAYTDIRFARSNDGGKTWHSQWDAPLMNTTYELAFDPEVPGRMWAAISAVHDIPHGNIILGRHRGEGGGCVATSDDFGGTWRDESEGLPEAPVVSVVVDPSSPKEGRVLYASVWEHGVFRSGDGGKTWVEKTKGLGASGRNVRCCRLILHGDGTLFCLVTALMEAGRFLQDGVGLYRSRDGGESWEWINRSRPLLWPKDFDVDGSDSEVIYLGAADTPGRREGGLYKTTDGGQSWRLVAREGPQVFGATVHPQRPGWVYMALCEGAPGPGLWLSKDSCETWKPFRGIPFKNIQRIAFDPDNDGIIYVTTFGGSVWKGPAEE